jgi:DNA polymerase III delta prime subunit
MKIFEAALAADDFVPYTAENRNNLLGKVIELMELIDSGEHDNSIALREKAASLAPKLHITTRQMILFTLVLHAQKDNAVSMSEIAKSIAKPKIYLQQFKNDFEELRQKRLLRMYCGMGRMNHDADREITSYIVPDAVTDELGCKTEWTEKKHAQLSKVEFFDELGSLFDQCFEDAISAGYFSTELSLLVSNNSHLEFVQTVNKYKLSWDDCLLLLCFCNQTVGDNQNVQYQAIESICGSHCRAMRIWHELQKEEHRLQKMQIVEAAIQEGGFGNTESFCLTSKAQDILLGDMAEKQLTKKQVKGLIDHETIVVKELRYNRDERGRIERLESLLAQDSFHDVCKCLEAGNMRLGFTCLFSGEPGTGKTETVLQLAKKTARDVMKVDIASTKTKWFGESEKLIKGIFDRYRTLVRDAEEKKYNAPILFFNEADGILGKRQSLSGEHNGPLQTENAIQNIILDEMENLNGILIATTNLAANLDRAFERRFLYKIEFSRPDCESRKAIWQSMFPDLADNDAEDLASTFEFSGGQIENIARKRLVDAVLFDEPSNMDAMLALCREEKMDKEKRQIGFCS